MDKQHLLRFSDGTIDAMANIGRKAGISVSCGWEDWYTKGQRGTRELR